MCEDNLRTLSCHGFSRLIIKLIGRNLHARLCRWNAKCNFKELQFARQKSVECYFSAAATMFEPEMAKARLVWARCCVLTTVLDDYFDVGGTIEELRLFLEAVKRWSFLLFRFPTYLLIVSWNFKQQRNQQRRKNRTKDFCVLRFKC